MFESIEKVSTGRKALIIIGLLVTNFAVMAYMNPAQVCADTLFELFPQFGVDFVLSGPALLFCVGSLVCPAILNRTKVTSKILMLIGVALTAVGIVAVSVQEITYMIIMASIIGLGSGMTNECGMIMLFELYADEKKHASMVGLYNACTALAGSILSYLMGIFAVSHWTNGWNIYWIMIPAFILALLFLPNIKKDAKEIQEEQGEKHFGGANWIALIEFFVYMLALYAPCILLVSLIVAECGLGDSSIAGLAISVQTLSACVFNLFFGLIYNKIKRCGIFIGCILLIVGFLILAANPCVPTLIIMELLGGFAYAVAYSWIFTYPCAKMSPASANTWSGLSLAASSLGCFLASFLGTFLMETFTGGEFMGTLPIFVGIFVVVAVVDLICVFVFRRKDCGVEESAAEESAQ